VQLEKYICGIVTATNLKPLAFFCNPDHCHLLVGLHLAVAVATLAREVKANSSRSINQQQFIRSSFTWQ
jgi:REP element-mobilizing transposase RayT